MWMEIDMFDLSPSPNRLDDFIEPDVRQSLTFSTEEDLLFMLRGCLAVLVGVFPQRLS